MLPDPPERLQAAARARLEFSRRNVVRECAPEFPLRFGSHAKRRSSWCTGGPPSPLPPHIVHIAFTRARPGRFAPSSPRRTSTHVLLRTAPRSARRSNLIATPWPVLQRLCGPGSHLRPEGGGQRPANVRLARQAAARPPVHRRPRRLPHRAQSWKSCRTGSSWRAREDSNFRPSDS